MTVFLLVSVGSCCVLQAGMALGRNGIARAFVLAVIGAAVLGVAAHVGCGAA